jgi:ABC-type Fe3+-citrate transport system substrate-binding protein
LQASIVKKSAEATQSIYDSFQKKLVFKMISAIKDGQNKCGIDALWKRYLSLSDRESMRKGTDKPLVDNKEELLGIIEALEADNLVMMAAEDNQVILI